MTESHRLFGVSPKESKKFYFETSVIKRFSKSLKSTLIKEAIIEDYGTLLIRLYF